MTKTHHRVFTAILCALLWSGCQQSSPAPAEITEPTKKEVEAHRLTGLLPIGLLSGQRLVVSTFPASSTKQENEIQIVDHTGKVEKTLATARDGKTIYNSVLMDDWVVYAEASNDMIKEDWSVYAVKTDGSETLSIDGNIGEEIDTKLGTPTLIGPNLSASEGKLAFSTYQLNENHAVEAVLKVYDFKERKGMIVEKMSAALGNFYGHPSIKGDLLVYDASRTDEAAGGTVGDVYLKDLETGKRKVLDSGLNVTSPVLNSTAVVWVKGRDEIKMHDLTTDQTTTISKGIQAWLPSMNEHVLTWNHDSLVPYYSLADQKKTNLRNSEKEFGATIRGDLMYWTIKGEEVPTVEWVHLSDSN